MPSGVPFVAGSLQYGYKEHLVWDGVVPVPGSTFSELETENLEGHWSGLGPSSPWCTPRTMGPIPLQDAGTSSASAATTLTDASKAWVVNQYAGRVVKAKVAGGADTYGIVASNTATILTLTAAGWNNGTPQAVGIYTITPTASAFGAAGTAKFDNWPMESNGPRDNNTDKI